LRRSVYASYRDNIRLPVSCFLSHSVYVSYRENNRLLSGVFLRHSVYVLVIETTSVCYIVSATSDDLSQSCLRSPASDPTVRSYDVISN